MKATRQRLLTTISTVVDCWDRAKTHKDFAEQVGIHIEDLRDILNRELIAVHDRRVAHVPGKNRIRMESLYRTGLSILQESRKGRRQ